MVKNSLHRSLLLPVVIVISVVVLSSAIMVASFEGNRLRAHAGETMNQQSVGLQSLFAATGAIMQDRVQSSMRLLRQKTEALGAPSAGGLVALQDGLPRDANELYFGGRAQANRFNLVDEVVDISGGTATLFSRTGDDFVRVSTNVRMDNGARAVGTVLDPKGPAIVKLREGQPYYGVVDILGNPWITGYEPIRNSAGQVIGAWYVGYQADMQAFADVIGNSRILKEGFVALFDAKGKLRFHSKSQRDEETIKSFLADAPDEWIVSKQPVSLWNFTLISAFPKSDIEQTIRTQSLTIVGSGLLIAALLAAMLSSLIMKRVISPIRSLTEAADDISRGKSREIAGADGTDEIGLLAKSIARLSSSLTMTMARLAAQRNKA